MNIIRNFNFLLVIFCLSSCVSVKLAGTDSSSSKFESPTYQSPTSPFYKSSTLSGDSSWISRQTGSIISYLSECSKTKDIDLKTLESDSISTLENSLTEQILIKEYNNRKAIFSKTTGEVDGVKLFLELVIFKKNNCSFTLSYTGRIENQAIEASHFISFYNSFKVP